MPYSYPESLTCRRLIQNQNFRPPQKCPRQADQLTLANAEVFAVLRYHVLQTGVQRANVLGQVGVPEGFPKLGVAVQALSIPNRVINEANLSLSGPPHRKYWIPILRPPPLPLHLQLAVLADPLHTNYIRLHLRGHADHPVEIERHREGVGNDEAHKAGPLLEGLPVDDGEDGGEDDN
ncbi:hypothetical protein TYRP_005333 [Tyrophagus putrescentiae]|nr:hypothetical protein TYRP_005333 [Tyrophagus putrescentiae]